MQTTKENKKSVRIFLAQSMLPDVGSMSRVGKAQWAVKTKSFFSVAIADVGIGSGSQLHRDALNRLDEDGQRSA